MAQDNQPEETKNKTFREWIRAIGTFAAGLGILTGLLTFLFTKEKEASDRLLNIINLLDSENCQTVRAGAVSTLGVYLEDYKQYQNRAYWVMANNLATEEDPLVRDNILNILRKAEADAIIPLACMSRFLLEEKMLMRSSFLFGFDLAFQSDLDNGRMSDELRKKFKDNLVELSECVTVLVVEKDSRWFITNRDNKPTYSVKKERDQLNVYEKDIPIDSDAPVSTPIEPGPIDKLSIIEESENLRDITKALVAVLEKKGFPKAEKLHLQKIILCNNEPYTKINLSRVNLKQAFLMEAYLKGVSLKDAILEQANLQNAVLNNVDLAGANMRGANLNSVKLQGDTVLRGADLTSMLLFSIKAKKFQNYLDKGTDKVTVSNDLRQEFEDNGIYLSQNATVSIVKNDTKYMIFDDGQRKCRIAKEGKKLNIYSDAILEKARLEYTDLKDTDLTNANLLGANLVGADMQSATLNGADIDTADLTDANLVDANLTDVSLMGANLNRTKMMRTTLQGADLFRADLTDAILEKANLKGANLADADLKGANLVHADLEGAILTDANLADANLTTVNFAGADLSGANMEGADLKNAKLKAKVLFRIDPNKFQSDLDRGMISEDLKREFENKRFYLSQNTTISIEKKDSRWLINDKDYEQTYTLRRDGGQIDVCKDIKFDFEGIKKAKNWDKATFDDDVKQKLFSSQD